MGVQPSGTVTLLFSDIEGSTRLLHVLGAERYADALERHRIVLRDAFGRHGGFEVDCEGDAFFVAFASAADAVAAGSEAQLALAGETWPADMALRVRMGLHTGEPLVVAPKYVGVDVHRAARIMAAGHGGQVLVSQTTRDLLGESWPLRDLGEQRLKDLLQPERLYQLQIAGLASEFPPLRSLNATNLPVAAWPLVGRRQELAEIGELLRDGARLLTLTGPGGSGKTRLALQVAADSVDDFRDGVFFVGLAPLRLAELVPGEIVRALGIGPTSEPLELLHEHLAEQQLLLVLDNAEHLPGLAEILASFSEARRLRLLVTSRAPLHLSWEREYRVDPLPEADAIEFFTERARAVRRDFAADTAVPELCRRLDGLPLALELAAARTKLLSTAAILDRLDTVLPFLTTGPRDLPERQHTLRATIAWSYDLLEPSEQALFRRLAVFRGGFPLQAAETVCNTDLDHLETLADNSLLKPVTGDRFFMLETIREYALEQLQHAGETAVYFQRHADHYLAELEQIEPVLRGPRTGEFLAWYDGEADNLRAAFQRLLELDQADAAARLATLLSSYWTARGQLLEGREALQRVLRDQAVTPEQRAPALQRLADIASRQGSAAEAARFATESLELAEAISDKETQAEALRELAWLTSGLDPARALELVNRAEQIAQTLDDNERSLSNCLADKGNDLRQLGDYVGARAAIERAISISERTDDEANAAIRLNMLGELTFVERDYENSARILADAIERLRKIGLDGALPRALYGLGYAKLMLYDDSAAMAVLREALELANRLGARVELLSAIAGIAIASSCERPEEAAQLWGAFAPILQGLGLGAFGDIELALQRERLPALERTLGATKFASQISRGATLDLAAAYELARDLAGPTDDPVPVKLARTDRTASTPPD